MGISQSVSGRAFEFALLQALHNKLDNGQKIKIKKDGQYDQIKAAYGEAGRVKSTVEYDNAAKKAVTFLIDHEPKLREGKNLLDEIILSRQSDPHGQTGDVRDIMSERKAQGWEIGISGKWNNDSVKSPRLSSHKCFGEAWLGLPCSGEYLPKMKEIFKDNKSDKRNWSDVPEEEKMNKYYKPVADVFIDELNFLRKRNKTIATKIASYFIGRQDFYKVIGKKSQVVIEGYNFHKTLEIPSTKLPDEITDVRLLPPTNKEKQGKTIVITCNRGWQFHGRIHIKDTRVSDSESLGIEITLEGKGKSLFTHNIY